MSVSYHPQPDKYGIVKSLKHNKCEKFFNVQYLILHTKYYMQLIYHIKLNK